jgi:hypothetical protein
MHAFPSKHCLTSSQAGSGSKYGLSRLHTTAVRAPRTYGMNLNGKLFASQSCSVALSMHEPSAPPAPLNEPASWTEREPNK